MELSELVKQSLKEKKQQAKMYIVAAGDSLSSDIYDSGMLVPEVQIFMSRSFFRDYNKLKHGTTSVRKPDPFELWKALYPYLVGRGLKDQNQNQIDEPIKELKNWGKPVQCYYTDKKANGDVILRVKALYDPTWN